MANARIGEDQSTTFSVPAKRFIREDACGCCEATGLPPEKETFPSHQLRPANLAPALGVAQAVKVGFFVCHEDNDPLDLGEILFMKQSVSPAFVIRSTDG